jgi:hypothetical protein
MLGVALEDLRRLDAETLVDRRDDVVPLSLL